jgi:hypothetical protein
MNTLYIVICIGYIDGFWIIWLDYCALYIRTPRDYKQYSTIAILHNLLFTVRHALGFSVFISRILATDL